MNRFLVSGSQDRSLVKEEDEIAKSRVGRTTRGQQVQTKTTTHTPPNSRHPPEHQMDLVAELYYGVVDTYNIVYPWIPLQLRASVQTLLTQGWLIIHVLLTNPSEIQHMIPTVVSTLALAVTVYWTVTTVYHSVRRVFRVTFVLLKYGSIVVLLLALLGWMSPADPNRDLTIPVAIESGWHTLMGFVDELPKRHTAGQPRNEPGKPWERFTPRDGHSSNPRHKPRKPKSHSRSNAAKSTSSQPQGGASATNPLAEFGIVDALGWLSTLRQSVSNGESGEWEETEFAQKMRHVWEKVKVDAFTPQHSNEEGMTDTDDAGLGNEDDGGQTELR